MGTWQDIVVALVALAAAGLVLRRLVGFVRPSRAAAGCEHCATGAPTRSAGPTRPGAAPDEHPLVFIKSPRR